MSEAQLVTTPPSVGAVSPVRVRVAAVWRRAMAGVVDVLMLSCVFLGLFVGVSVLLGEPLPRLSQIGPDYFVDAAVSGHAKTAIGLVVAAISGFCYFFTFHALRGQTPGKRLVGIRVIDAYGEPGEDYPVSMENRTGRMERIEVRDVLEKVGVWRERYGLRQRTED